MPGSRCSSNAQRTGIRVLLNWGANSARSNVLLASSSERCPRYIDLEAARRTERSGSSVWIRSSNVEMSSRTKSHWVLAFEP